MAKKIVTVLFVVSILATGYFGFRKLNYWDRSTRIFNLNSNQRLGNEQRRGPEGIERGGGFNRPSGTGESFERRELRDLPDSIRNRMQAAREGFRGREGEFRGRPSGEGGRGRGDRGRGGEFSGSQVRLGNVGWFLAVFAFFTVVAVYLDKAVKLFTRKRRS